MGGRRPPRSPAEAGPLVRAPAPLSGGLVSAYHYDPLLWPTLGSAAFIGAIAL